VFASAPFHTGAAPTRSLNAFSLARAVPSATVTRCTCSLLCFAGETACHRSHCNSTAKRREQQLTAVIWYLLIHLKAYQKNLPLETVVWLAIEAKEALLYHRHLFAPVQPLHARSMPFLWLVLSQMLV
jgi:hypothetical protein